VIENAIPVPIRQLAGNAGFEPAVVLKKVSDAKDAEIRNTYLNSTLGAVYQPLNPGVWWNGAWAIAGAALNGIVSGFSQEVDYVFSLGWLPFPLPPLAAPETVAGQTGDAALRMSLAAASGTAVTGAEQTQTTNEQGQLVSTRERRIDPYYLQMRLPDRENEDFLILRSFVPVSDNDERKQLTSFMVGLSDPEDYGQLRVYEMPNLNVDGPAIVNATMLQNEAVSSRISLLNQQGSTVKLGSLLLIPIEESLLYVRPLYVEAQGDTPVPQLKNVIVAFGDQVEMRSTLQSALEAIFGEAPDTLEDPSADDQGTTGSGDTGSGDNGTAAEPTGTTAEQIAALLARAEDLFAEADQALADGDLGTYQAKVDEARDLVQQAIDLGGAERSGASGSTTTTTTAPPDSSA